LTSRCPHVNMERKRGHDQELNDGEETEYITATEPGERHLTGCD
jgi:hypothetical protein